MSAEKFIEVITNVYKSNQQRFDSLSPIVKSLIVGVVVYFAVAVVGKKTWRFFAD